MAFENNWLQLKGRAIKIKTFSQTIKGVVKEVWLDCDGHLHSIVMESGITINGRTVETAKEY